jgi:tRNA A-37 threonylcarbamoyl transferase component Bud32
LSIWSIGARSFALIGRSRLERECAINDLLGKAGINVPKILHVSANERLVFMDFLEGENLSYAIKRIAAAHANDNYEKDLALVAQVGETYAKVHALDVALGDTKPENSMVDPQDKIYLLDFEQATRNGDKAWDLACFLYYCGHYMPLNGEHKAEQITKAFITGYLRGGGNVEFVKCVGLAKYTRVFSVFTLPGVLRVIASTCRNIEGRPRKKSLLERAKEAVE